MSHTYQNPIIPGFYPDPSICRVGEDYYLVTSTFEYFPGLPIFHSQDLVNWRQVGHVLDRPSQLPLDGIRASGGLYAPTIRYHNGLFYVINTLVDGLDQKGNFIVTAKNPRGPWSEPFWLEDAPGIDPSLLFDEDGRAWYCGNRISPSGEQYSGHREIWLQELDLNKMQLSGPKYSLWDGALKGNLHAEAPHLYKINGNYYLMVAEAGTGHNHAVTIARSANITGPYENNHRNPILTHRHLGLGYPIVGTGHADLVETQNAEWWMVCLAMRPYGGYFYNLGRETFLVPVAWEDGWPVVAPGVGKVRFNGPAPALPEKTWSKDPACDNFDSLALGFAWNFIRTPRQTFWSLSDRPGYLSMQLRPETIMERVNPSFIGRRQQHINFTAALAMEFAPVNTAECAGLVLLQNENFQIRCVSTVSPDGELILQVTKRKAGVDQLHHEQIIHPGRVYLRVEAKGQEYQFSAGNQYGKWFALGEPVDGRVLSTPVAGGFTGAYLGMYASSNGNPSDSQAYFDWFEYLGE
jgi:alpha-N-arabinofuranosidase